MRVRVSGNRVANENKKAKKNNKFRNKKKIYANMSGRIQLKDMKGRSYMEMGFYKRPPVPNEKMRIIFLYLDNIREKENSDKIGETFVFKKRQDRYP